MHLGVDIKIPQSYLHDAGHRLALYKRLAQSTQAEDVDRLQAETEDRFGHLPQAALNLFDMGRLRVLAEQLGVKSIDVVEGELHVRFHEAPTVDPGRIVEILSSDRGTLTTSGKMVLPAPQRGSERIECAANLLRRMIGTSKT